MKQDIFKLIYLTQPCHSTPFYLPILRLLNKCRIATAADPKSQPELLPCEFPLAYRQASYTFVAHNESP